MNAAVAARGKVMGALPAAGEMADAPCAEGKMAAAGA